MQVAKIRGSIISVIYTPPVIDKLRSFNLNGVGEDGLQKIVYGFTTVVTLTPWGAQRVYQIPGKFERRDFVV